MAIQDSDAERRNLMMSSLGFILYYAAGGKFIDNQVHIQMVNLTFSKPQTLALIAWVMLFWFLLRYWQTHKYKVSSTISKDVSDVLSLNLKSKLISYLEHKKGIIFEGEGPEPINFIFDRVEIKLFKWVAHYTIVKNFSKKSGSSASYLPVSEEEYYLTRPIGIILVISAIAIACIKNKGFTSYAVPYILFIAAVISPLL